MDVGVHDQPRAGHARLAGRGEHAGDHAVGGRAEVGVVEHDLRRLAAELERDLVEVLGRGVGDRAAGGGGAGEGDLVHAGVAGQRGAELARLRR